MPSGQSPTVVVTGATGLIGRHVVWQLQDAGYAVRAQVRAGSDRGLFDGLELEFIEADLTQPETLPAVITGADFVVHAARLTESGATAEAYRQANVTALECLLTAARQNANFQRWIQISSLDVYPLRDHHGTDEQAPIDLEELAPCARSTAEAELLIARHVAEGFPAVILRPGWVYGAGDRHTLPNLVQQIHEGRLSLPGGGQQTLHNTSVHNLADAVLLALKQDAAVGEVFHVRDARPIAASELVERIADYLDCPPPTAGWLSRLTGGRNSLPPWLHGEQLDFSIDKARRLLGYDPQMDFAVGIREALDAVTP